MWIRVNSSSRNNNKSNTQHTHHVMCNVRTAEWSVIKFITMGSIMYALYNCTYISIHEMQNAERRASVVGPLANYSRPDPPDPYFILYISILNQHSSTPPLIHSFKYLSIQSPFLNTHNHITHNPLFLYTGTNLVSKSNHHLFYAPFPSVPAQQRKLKTQNQFVASFFILLWLEICGKIKQILIPGSSVTAEQVKIKSM